jgi:lipopolysaccharide transport system permease protein
VGALAYRQFTVRYRQSMVGILWAVLPTIGTLIAATFVFKGVAKVNTGDVPYPLFAMSALVPWSFFAASLGSGIPTISNSGLISKLSFPRAVLPLSQMGLAAIDMVISFGIFILFLLFDGSFLTISALWFFPLFAVEVALVAGLVLTGSALNAFARDVRLAVPAVLQLWLLLTPVMYPLSAVPSRLRPFYLANPMTGLVVGFRSALADGKAPDLTLIWPAVLMAAFFLLVGSWYFSSVERRFADVL